MEYDLGISEEPYATACQMYWQIDEHGFFVYKVSEIAKATGLTQPKINETVTQYTRAYSDETFCLDCEQPYIYKNRTDYQNLLEGKNWRCGDCLEAIAFDESKHKRHELQMRYDRLSEEGYMPAEMDIDSMAKLMALLKHSASEDMTTIQPIGKNKDDPFSPNDEYTRSILSELLSSNAITFDPNSNMDRIIFEDDGSITYYPFEVNWLVPLGPDYATLGEFYLSLEKQLPELLRLEGAERSVKELCMQECLSYLEFILTEHRLPFKPGEKTRLVLEKGLQHFTVSQMYAIIWSTGNSAASYYMRGNIPKQQAANSVVGRIDGYIDRALAENWNVKSFGRRFDLPQSALSRLVFNNLLGTSDGGFNLPLSELLEMAKSDLDKDEAEFLNKP